MSASGSSNDGAACPGAASHRFYSLFFFEFALTRTARCTNEAYSGATYNRSAKQNLLGGVTPREFLRPTGKKPLYVRDALPRSKACSMSRQIARARAARRRRNPHRGAPWHAAQHGARPLLACGRKLRGWTLLVSGVNLHHAAADALLRRFSFIPQARLDDVM